MIEQKLQELKTSHGTKNSDAISENPWKVLFEWKTKEELKSIELNLERIKYEQELQHAGKGLISESSDEIFECQKLHYLGRLLELKEIEWDVKRIKDKQDLLRAKKEDPKSGSSNTNPLLPMMDLHKPKIKFIEIEWDVKRIKDKQDLLRAKKEDPKSGSSNTNPLLPMMDLHKPKIKFIGIILNLMRIKDKQDLLRAKKGGSNSESRCEFPKSLEMLSLEGNFEFKAAKIERDLRRIKDEQDLERAKKEGPNSESRCENPSILEMQSYHRSSELTAIELELKRQNDKEELQRTRKGLVSQRSDAMSEPQWLKSLERFYVLKVIELALQKQMDKQKLHRTGFGARSSDEMSGCELMQTLERLFEFDKRDLKRLNKKQERQWMQALERFIEIKEIDLTLTRIECEKILQREEICYQSEYSDAMSKDIEPKIYTARDNESLQRARESYRSKSKDTALEFERKLPEHNTQLQMDIDNLQSERIRINKKKKMEYEKKMEYDQKLPLALENQISDCSGGISKLKC